LIAAAALVVFLLMRHRLHSFRPIVVPKTPGEIAYERIAGLERRNLLAQGKVKEYFSALSDIIRRYIEARFNIQAPEMTTEEFLNSLKSNPSIDTKHKETLKKFLLLSDMVKFAKYGPDVTEVKESLELAKQFIRETTVQEPAPVPKTQS